MDINLPMKKYALN